MKSLQSESLTLIWRLAEMEARQLGAGWIKPVHLLIGLCKSVDLDVLAIVAVDLPGRDEILEELLREIRRLRNIFHAANLDARAFRHALRSKASAERVVIPEAQFLHRTEAAKRMFAEAGQFAEMGGSKIYPAHLLYAVLSDADGVRDGLLKELGVRPSFLMNEARREAMPTLANRMRPAGLN